MSISIRVPASLKKFLGDNDHVICEGNTIEECINDLDAMHSGFKEMVLDSEGQISNSLLIFIDGENILNLDGLTTPVNDGNEISIIPYAAGG
ncbi:MAG: MoaD/ThiS family protein [Spirochaetota bacterium]|nr:MoaD/ThiS family protein [Spirochaetota bacterium]